MANTFNRTRPRDTACSHQKSLASFQSERLSHEQVMSNEPSIPAPNSFERIKRVNDRGGEFWSARELARVLEYADFRNFITVLAKARQACVNSGRAISDHFVDITEMVGI